MTISPAAALRLWSSPALQAQSFNNATGMVLDADNKMLAFKYFPPTTSPITDIDVCLHVNGTVTDTNFKLRVESNNADAPSGTILGTTNNAITAEFAGLAADGLTGLKTLVENTGNLTLNTPVWVVLARSSGGSLSASEYVQWRGTFGVSQFASADRLRHYNGTNWTTTAAVTSALIFIVKHLDGTVVGLPLTTATANTTAADIYGTNRQGVRLKSGSKLSIPGVLLNITKTGAPADLVVAVYEGSTLKYSETISVALPISQVWTPVYFSSPVPLAADANIYIVLSQAADGGSDAADYDCRVYPSISADYISALLPADMRFVYGTGNDPTAYTISNTELPISIVPLIADTAVDFDCAVAGSGASGPWGMIR